MDSQLLRNVCHMEGLKSLLDSWVPDFSAAPEVVWREKRRQQHAGFPIEQYLADPAIAVLKGVDVLKGAVEFQRLKFVGHNKQPLHFTRYAVGRTGHYVWAYPDAAGAEPT